VDRTPAATRRPFRVGLVLLAWAAVFAGLWLAREVLLLGFLGVLIAVVFSFPVDWLSRWMPRGMAVLLVLVLLGGMLTALGFLAAPTLKRRKVSEERGSRVGRDRLARPRRRRKRWPR